MQEELRPLFETMMCDGANSVGAESCTLWIVDSDGEHLWSKVRQGPGTNLSNDESEVRIDLGAFPLRHEVVRLAAEGRPAILNCEDVQADPRFNSSADLYSGRTTRSLLVAPVVGDGGIVLAIVGEVGTNTNHQTSHAVVLTLATINSITYTIHRIREQTSTWPHFFRGRRARDQVY